jgi:hypothetical protein
VKKQQNKKMSLFIRTDAKNRPTAILHAPAWTRGPQTDDWAAKLA